MNRPKMPKYVTRSKYTIKLEKYCDQLEKALDKACERLRDFDEIEQLNYGLRMPRDVEDWKEWALDESN